MTSKLDAANCSIDNCRACGLNRVEPFLDLGEHPLANGFLAESDLLVDEFTHELKIFRCLDCGMMQSVDCVPVDFFRNYVYVSSASTTMIDHFNQMADDLADKHKLHRDSVVVDIGCNDCTLLNRLAKYSANCIGVDPAENITQRINGDRVTIVSEYFGVATLDIVKRATGKKANLITCNNTYHHIGSLNDFTTAVKHLLHEDGVFVLELPYGPEIIKGLQFDGFYHEHLSQFTCKAIDEQLQLHGLMMVDVQQVDVHGNSIRVTACHNNRMGRSDNVVRMIEEEQIFGIGNRQLYEEFAEKTHDVKTDLNNILSKIISESGRIAGYGASARGNTLLNYCGIGNEVLDCIYDTNSLKQGLYTPKSKLLVKHPSALKDDRCDYILLLAWNFESEIRGQLRHFLDRGGRFIIPLPKPMII